MLPSSSLLINFISLTIHHPRKEKMRKNSGGEQTFEIFFIYISCCWKGTGFFHSGLFFFTTRLPNNCWSKEISFFPQFPHWVECQLNNFWHFCSSSPSSILTRCKFMIQVPKGSLNEQITNIFPLYSPFRWDVNWVSYENWLEVYGEVQFLILNVENLEEFTPKNYIENVKKENPWHTQEICVANKKYCWVCHEFRIVRKMIAETIFNAKNF